MTVALRPITRDNLWAVVDLKVHPGQEAFVAENIDSIANAYVEPTFVPLGVYTGDELVGFAMYGQHDETGGWWVLRLMIDREHQGKGYGRAAMEAVIAMMAERAGCEEIVTSFVPANAAAAGLYASLGFRPTGEVEDGEQLVVLRLADRRSQRGHRSSTTPGRDGDVGMGEPLGLRSPKSGMIEAGQRAVPSARRS